MADFADRIKLYRTMNGFTQEEVASRLGTNKQTISRYEKGQLIPRLDVAMELAEKLRVDLFWLIGIDDIKKAPEDDARKNLCDLIANIDDSQVALLAEVVRNMREPEDKAI